MANGTSTVTVTGTAALRFAEIFGKEPIFTGAAQATAWHNHCSQAQTLFGDPVINLETMLRWNADPTLPDAASQAHAL